MSDLADRLKNWNRDADARIKTLRERAASRELARAFVAGLGTIARELWDEIGKDALKALAASLVADALDNLEK